MKDDFDQIEFERSLDEGAPRPLTESQSYPARPAPREYGPQEIHVIQTTGGVPVTVTCGVLTQYVDVLFDNSDGYIAPGGYVAALAGLHGHADLFGVKLGMQSQQQVTVVTVGDGIVYLCFNDHPFRVWGA